MAEGLGAAARTLLSAAVVLALFTWMLFIVATALRHVAVLCEAGLATRSADAADARRSFVSLTQEARKALVDLLTEDG